MKEFFIICKETCPACNGSKLILDKEGHEVRLKCEKCDENGIFTHEVNIKNVAALADNSPWPSGGMSGS